MRSHNLRRRFGQVQSSQSTSRSYGSIGGGLGLILRIMLVNSSSRWSNMLFNMLFNMLSVCRWLRVCSCISRNSICARSLQIHIHNTGNMGSSYFLSPWPMWRPLSNIHNTESSSYFTDSSRTSQLPLRSI